MDAENLSPVLSPRTTIDNEHIPLSNRRSTIFGVIIALQIIAVIAVLLRLYARVRLVHSPGWDDLFVFLAMLALIVGTVFVCIATTAGMGQHLFTLDPDQVQRFLFSFYIANAIYVLTTGFIKISLLFQYLRVYKTGRMRWLCIGLLVFTALWCATFAFMAWFPCFPLRAHWNWAISDFHCYGYGARHEQPVVDVYESHTAINMLLDAIILLMPIHMCLSKKVSKKEKFGVVGLLSVGVIVIWLSIWRLVTIVQHKAGWAPQVDWTWFSSISIVLSCAEVNVAILAACMPIFWPIIEPILGGIFVTHEVHIETHARLESNENLEIMDSRAKSDDGSEVELKRKASGADHYHDAFMESVSSQKAGIVSTVEARTNSPRDHGGFPDGGKSRKASAG